MEKRLLKRIIASLLCIEIVSILWSAFFFFYRTEKSIFFSMDQILKQEEQFYRETREIQMEKYSYYANDYITRAMAIDYMLCEQSQSESNTKEKMDELKTLYNIEEIYAFDKEGTIAMSTDSEAIGTRFKDSENASPFRSMIENGEEDVVFSFDMEEILEHGAGLNYIAVKSKSDDYSMILIGVERSIAQKLLEDTSPSGLLKRIPTIGRESVFILDASSGEILGESQKQGESPELSDFDNPKDLLLLVQDAEDGRIAWLNGHLVFMKARLVDDCILVSIRNAGAQVRQALYMLLGATVLLTVCALVLVMVTKYYFRKVVLSEITSIQQTIHRMITGEEKAEFQYGSMELKPIITALEDWIYNIRHTREKLNWALSASDANTAIFEKQTYVNSIYCSDNFQTVLGIGDAVWETLTGDTAAFMSYMRGLSEMKNQQGIVQVNGKYLQIKLFEVERDALGVVIDKTEEIQSRSEQESALKKAVDASEKDSLTGLLNRRGLERQIQLALSAGAESMTMLMMDVDNFKLVNDTLGHPVGDQVLRRIADILKEQFRKNDVVVRLGGDEFAVLLSSTMPMETLRSKISSVLYIIAEELSVFQCDLSVSIGVACVESVSCYEKLYQWADEALYDAKRAGKNTYSISCHGTGK